MSKVLGCRGRREERSEEERKGEKMKKGKEAGGKGEIRGREKCERRVGE